MLQQFISRISRIGLPDDAPFSLRNKLKVFNIAIFSIFLISCFYLVLAVTHGYFFSTIVTVYSIASTLVILFLVYTRKYAAAFHYGMLYGLIFLSAFTILFGAVTNSHFYFMFLPVAVNILFDDRRTIAVYFVLTVICTLGNIWWIDNVSPYYTTEINERWLGYPNIPFVLVLIFLAVRMFRNENRKYAARIEEQRMIVEEKNQEITDSITYARRIQQALLAPATLLKKHLPEHFVLYRPKDIVSGDFYWATAGTRDESHVSATAQPFWLCIGDCTGHGVPGAFMSLLNISILRELIVEQKIDRPDRVLNKQREAIIRSLNPDGAETSGKDGMDCVLIRFDLVQNTISFACANNGLWIIRNNELIEFKPDKQPVGLHEGVQNSYTLHEFALQRGDFVVAYTDGFADQFGGPRGKKYKYSQLKQLLVRCAGESSVMQHKLLSEEFDRWKEGREQIDDVLILGIKI